MRLESLLTRLPDGALGATHYADRQAEVYTLSFITFDQKSVREDVLYFGDATQLPASLPPDAFANFIVYGETQVPAALLDSKNVNVITLTPGADPYACYNALQAFFIEDQEVTDIVRRMLTAHFSNNGLQYLIEEASNALDNPILVVDTSYHYIAYYLGDLGEGDSTFAKVMGQELSFESVLEPGVDYIMRTKVDERISRTRAPLVQYNDHLGCQTLTGAVFVHGVCLAHVLLAGVNHPIRDRDVECFGRLTHFVGQELQKIPVYETSKGQMGAYFLSNLLDDEQPSPAVIKRRLKVLDYHPYPVFHVCVMRPREEPLTAQGISNIANQLLPILNHCVYSQYEDQLVILFNLKEEGDLGEYAGNLLRKVAGLNDLAVGLSNSFGDLVEIRTYYQQAKDAIKFGTIVSDAIDDHNLYHFCDYAYVQTLYLTSKTHGLMQFCHPSLLKLMDYDREHGTELMETLFEYLQTAGNTTRAAAMLYLHKNTMLYRLNRIRSILGTDLSSGEDNFLLMYSYRILLYLGLFSPHRKIEREDLRRAAKSE